MSQLVSGVELKRIPTKQQFRRKLALVKVSEKFFSLSFKLLCWKNPWNKPEIKVFRNESKHVHRENQERLI